jgi:hypothetical protein
VDHNVWPFLGKQALHVGLAREVVLRFADDNDVSAPMPFERRYDMAAEEPAPAGDKDSFR